MKSSGEILRVMMRMLKQVKVMNLRRKVSIEELPRILRSSEASSPQYWHIRNGQVKIRTQDIEVHVILWKHEYVITYQLYFNITDSRQDFLPKYLLTK